jgi:acetyl-CoA carboxylase biotin carboxyl carrier protein
MDLNEDDVIQIIKYLDESNFNELRLQLGDLRIVVNRTGRLTPIPEADQAAAPTDLPAAPPSPSQHVEAPPQAVFPVEETRLPAEDPAGPGQRVTITSPMLGTFYRAPAPGEPPFVEVGSALDEDTTVCIIEVMKLFSTIKAEKRGRITRVSVEDGQLVEFGQVLFLLDQEVLGHEEQDQEAG